jgi:2-aminoadipate transaminase
MKWNTKIAPRMSKLSDSLLSVIINEVKPKNLISFAGGCPDNKMLPVSLVRSATEWALSKFPQDALQYGDPEGYLPLRELLAKNHGCSREHILISSGSQQILEFIGKLFLSAGNKVGVFSPTYMGLFRAWNPSMVEYVDLGKITDNLDFNQIENKIREGLKIIYVIPNYDNPSSQTISKNDRVKLSKLVVEYDVIVVEDDAYNELGFTKNNIPSLYSLCPDNTIYLRTFSKVIAPGLRIGWVLADPHVIECFSKMKLANDFHASLLSQLIIYYILSQSFKAYQLHVENIQEYYRKQAENLEIALANELANYATWEKPKGGLFAWITLNFAIDTCKLLRSCLKRGVSFMPGEMFFSDSRPSNSLRLCYSSSSDSEMYFAMRCLREEIEQQLNLYEHRYSPRQTGL